MAYEKQTWQSNELITTEKLNHMEDGIAAAVNPDIANNLTETTAGKVLDATQGKVLKDTIDNLDAEDVGAINESYSYDPASYPYTGQELILLHNPTTGENTVTDVASFLSSAGGGSGTNQSALVHYTKTISLSAGSTSQTFSDSNITENMVVLQAVIAVPAAQGSDWTFTTSNGSVTLNGTVNAATNVTLYFGVSMSAAPSIQVNLASTAADNILKTNPTPGVMGVLQLDHGGTGATTAAGACAALAPGIPTAAYTIIANYGTNVSKLYQTGDADCVRCIKYGNGLKRIIGVFSIDGSGIADGGLIFSVPTGFEHTDKNGNIQGWGSVTATSGGASYVFRFAGSDVTIWGSPGGVPSGLYIINYLYF